jgi:hypothetical protein
MNTVLLDYPWTLLCLLYVGAWLFILIHAHTGSSPPTQDGSPAGPTATGKAGAKATE